MGANHMIWWAADGARQQVGDVLLKDRVGLETDRVLVALGLDKLIDVRCGERGIASEVAAQVAFPVTLNDRLQNAAPSVGAVNVARTRSSLRSRSPNWLNTNSGW